MKSIKQTKNKGFIIKKRIVSYEKKKKRVIKRSD